MHEWSVVTPDPDLLGESPFWHPQERRLYWVDIPSNVIHRTDPAGGAVESWKVTSEPGCIAPLRSGGLMVALRDGIYRAPGWGAALTRLVGFSYDATVTRFNDGKADPAGRFWAGTMYEPRDARKAELYSVALSAEPNDLPRVELKAHNAVVANGLAWAPDARTIYWADTTNHVIHAWDWDAHSNEMSGHRVFQQFEPKPAGWKPGDPGYRGRPDGAAVDSQGHYWCAMFEGQRLLRFSPDGALVAEIATPARCPTMPCFGGDDLKTLYLTTARHNRPPEELAQFPQSGQVFAMRVDVPGLPVNFVSG